MPIEVDELHLGIEHYQNHERCRATASPEGDEYRIYAELSDCGTKILMNQDSLIYTNLLRYTPRESADGVLRMDSAVIPIECHYERKYSLDSGSLQPTWAPFTTSVLSEDALQFSLKLMTSDGLFERGSPVFFLGESISIEASVHIAHHTKLRVFVSSCVATVEPDAKSVPRYVIIENDGCLMDSLVPGSHSSFVHRIEDDKLQFHIDAFRFKQEKMDELYISCHVLAVPVTDHAEPSKKACSFIDGRWRSADENDLLCSRCPSPTVIDQAQHPLSPKPGVSRPGHHGYQSKHPASGGYWSGLKAKQVWEERTTLGPIKVLATKSKSESVTQRMREGIHVPGFPSITGEGRPISPGSRWKTGMDKKIGLYALTKNEVSPVGLWVGANNKQGFVSSATYDGYSGHKYLMAQREPIATAISLKTESLIHKDNNRFAGVEEFQIGPHGKELENETSAAIPTEQF
ncbi:hypothetical protein UPYG_G00113320 [Umbra pygmaea]|uniref:Zona pellucida sperm-binding protein 3 n=1 Tax=Umbra pygmaea TaxID=75934 RepID=A0ABD0XIU1_UMBPY